ncbi:MAG: acyltransferase [Bacteroidetes bacterium]|nr:acyltransferase [Bacteroidota bacterium]
MKNGKYIRSVIRSVFFNLKYFPLLQAIKLPVLLTPNVYLKVTKGKITITAPIRTGMIRIGEEGVGIFDYKHSRAIWEVWGEVIFQGTARIGHGSKISVGEAGKLTIGDEFLNSAESTICCFNEITFGRHCFLSWDILIMDTDYHKITDTEGKVINPDTPVHIGENVWIGCRSVILKGSSINDNNIIAAGSLISGTINGQNQVIGGVPAKVIRTGVNWIP